MNNVVRHPASVFEPELALDQRVEDLRRARQNKIRRALEDIELAKKAQKLAETARQRSRENLQDAHARLADLLDKNEAILVGETLIERQPHGGVEIRRVTVGGLF